MRNPTYKITGVTVRGRTDEVATESEFVADTVFRALKDSGMHRYAVLIHNSADGDYSVRQEWMLEKHP